MDNKFWLEGKVSIPEKNKEEFNKNVLRLLDSGGIRKTKKIGINGKEITVVHKPVPDDTGIVRFDCSIFEVYNREESYYDMNTCTLNIKNCGLGGFGIIMSTIMAMQEAYSTEQCYLMYGKEISSVYGHALLIEQLLGLRLSFTTREKMWDMFMFLNTPEELKGKPNYYISDDDRAFWWDGSEKVVFSKDMDKWLSDLSRRHQELLEEIPSDCDMGNFLRRLILVLAKVEAYYKRVYAFQNMFYEFLQNGADKRYFAAVLLMEELAEKNKEAGKIIEKAVNWGDTSRNVTHNEGRITMKRYLGVMANRRLREKYFGF